MTIHGIIGGRQENGTAKNTVERAKHNKLKFCTTVLAITGVLRPDKFEFGNSFATKAAIRPPPNACDAFT